MSNRLPAEAIAFYKRGQEAERLLHGTGQLELERTREIVLRDLPKPPVTVLDVGGGAGIHACWLATLGYRVHLIDAVPLHIEQAKAASEAQPDHPLASIAVGDARRLDWPDESVDAVLLFGPLYHLTERGDRIAALREARRVLRVGGYVFAAGISRFASMFDGWLHRRMDDPDFQRIVQRDLTDGQHRNLTDQAGYFTTTFFHHPFELKTEVEDAGLKHEGTLAIEGPGWLLNDFDEHWNDPARRQRLLDTIRRIEGEPTLLGASSHLMAVARKG